MNASDRQQPPGARLKRELQPVALSPAQRERHRRLIDSAFAARQTEATHVRGKFELAVVALALLCVVGAALLWGSLADDEQDAAEQAALEATLAAQQHATASALSTAVLAALPSFAPDACAVTPYATNPPFGVPRQDPAYADWYGSTGGGLWAAPVNRSVYRQSLVGADTRWFAGAASYVLWYGSLDPLQIQGRRLDGAGSFAGSGATKIDAFMSTQWTAFEIPSPGCWSITATAGDTTLDITVSVAPLEWRPDIVYLQRVSAARPYDPPATCAASPLLGPETTSDWFVAAYAARADGMLMSINQAWLAAERAESLHFTGPTLTRDAEIHARQAGASTAFKLRRASDQGRFGDIVFPSAGCWEIVVATPDQTTIFDVYVYPADCVPAGNDLSISAGCREPTD